MRAALALAVLGVLSLSAAAFLVAVSLGLAVVGLASLVAAYVVAYAERRRDA